MDFRADLALRKVIDGLVDKEYKPNNVELTYWKHLTEQIIRKKGVMFVVDLVLNSMEEVSDRDFLYHFIEEEKEKPKIKNKLKSNKLLEKLNNKISIINLAKKYGFVIKKNKSICKFHGDTDASLVFYPETNSFFCFGCRQGGNIINFVDLCNKNKLVIKDEQRSN